MAALVGVPPMHAHGLALAVLTREYVQRNCRRPPQQHDPLAALTPIKPAAAAPTSQVFHSPGDEANAESSFFSAASSPSGTPAPAAFNLGLGLAPLQQTSGGSAASPSSAQEDGRLFSKKSYQRLGRLLQKAIQNGCTYDHALFSASSVGGGDLAATPSSADLTTFPRAPPRFPTLTELKALLITQLPSQDDFNHAIERHLVEQLQLLQQPDDILTLITSLSSLLIVYSHKLPQTEHREFRALDESCPLGLFVRTQKLQLDAGMFDTLSRVFDTLSEYKRQGGLVEHTQPEEFSSAALVATPARAHLSGLTNPRYQFDRDEADVLGQLRQGLVSPAAAVGTDDAMDADGPDGWTEAGLGADAAWKDPWLFELEEGELAAEARARAQLDRTLPESLDDMPPATTVAPFLHACALRLPLLASRLDPSALDQLVSSLRRSAGSQLPLYYYLCYMKHVSSREYTEALDYCYRYFDYFSGQAVGDASADSQPKRHRTSTQQYASLALSHLHYSFAHYAASVTSIQETIKIAQQNKDEQALRFAMELLHKIIEAKACRHGSAAGSATTGGNLLHRCLITQANASLRSKKSSASTGLSASSPLPHLDAANALMMARFLCARTTADTGPGARAYAAANQPHQVWQAIERAMSLASSPRVPSLLASGHVLRASAWRMFGSTTLAHLSASLHLREHEHATAIDTVHALVQLALNPSACPTYDAQIAMLQAIKHRYPFPTEAGVQELVLHAEFDVELARGDLVRAQQVAQYIYAMAPVKATHFQHYAECQFVELRLSYHTRSAPLSSVFLRLLSLAHECLGRIERVVGTRVLTFIAHVLGGALDDDSSVGALCLTHVLDAHALAAGLHMRTVETEIRVYVAALHLELGDHLECERIISTCWSQLLKQCMPPPSATSPSTANGSASSSSRCASTGGLMCRVQLLLARCEMARITSDGRADATRHAESWHAVVQHLTTGLTYACAASQHLQLYYLLARAYEELGLTTQRNECAAQFCRLESQRS